MIQPSNYNIQYVNGLLTVNKDVLTAKVADTFRTYGDVNPVYRIIYDGFVNGDGPENIIPPVASTIADVTSCVGNYPVTLSGG